jgi:peptidoglycan-N-acetylglucosamine deacetylase
MVKKDSIQVFQTNNPTRWQRFKWGGRVLLFLLILVVAVIAVAFKNMYLPNLPMMQGQAMKEVLQSDKPTSQLAKKYQGFRKFIDNRWEKGRGCGQKDSVLNLSSSSLFSDSLGIRAAFYVAWDAQSFFSLKRNISKMNLVVPEWFFLDPNGDSVYTKIDERGFDVIKASGVRVMPMLTNNVKSVFRGDIVHRIINDTTKKKKLINDLIRLIKTNHFSGINIDFEELIETRNEVLTNFQKELYNRMHAEGLLVSQDVMPFNEDYDYQSLGKYNDYLFLMAYDEHSSDTKPGPVSSQRWIEAAVDQLARKVPPHKIVLCMAAYGYDWVKGGQGTDLTYQQALTVARESEGVVKYNNDTYNLSYSYFDDNDKPHEVHFTDAATNFNTLRFATEYPLAGTALWRLGSEDSRVWDFYTHPMSRKALASFNFYEFNKVEATDDVDFMGDGEILDVLSTPREGHITPEIDSSLMLISEERYDSLPSMFVVKQMGRIDASKKKLVLTFDDGPDPLYTRQILDILAKYKVPASFFVVGIEAENNIPLIKRIYNEGHELGNHTFTHPNMAKVSKQRALLEMDATRLLLECITGHSTIMFRAPYNADAQPEKMEELIPVALSRTRNYLTIGENIDPEDWEAEEVPNFNADTVFNRVIALRDRGNIILLHDAGGDRSATVEALPRIIEWLQKDGYTFTTVAELLHKKRDDMMPPVPEGSGYSVLQFSSMIAEIGYYVGRLFYALFIIFLILGTIRLVMMLLLSILQRRKEKAAALVAFTGSPLVSIIVPAYNEEVNAVSSIRNLLACDYPNFNIVFVDDGSKDQTYQIVSEAFANEPKVKFATKPNGGKASALNHGIALTEAEFVICIDADTKLLSNAVSKLMGHFINDKIGAVAGNVKVGNEVNILTRWQSIEYISSQNVDRKAFAFLNAITVVPGAIGAFRKKAIEEAGGFSTDTLAEDCDLTIRILRCGYQIDNENKAIAMTEAPESLNQFMKQRFRWTFGVMQTFWKNRDALFNPEYRALGWLALPDILLFKYIIPLFAPMADLLMLMGILTGNAEKIGIYYLVFMLVDAAIASLAFLFEKEPLWKLVWLLPQRLIYRWLMLVVLFRSYRRAIKGELQHWGVLKRTGNVKDIQIISKT